MTAPNTNITFNVGYLPQYFTITGGFELQANVVSDTVIDRNFEGQTERIVFQDGSKILIDSKADQGVLHNFHIYVLSPSQDIPLVGVPKPNIVDLGTEFDMPAGIFDPNFLSLWLAGNNTIGPGQNAVLNF